MELTMDGLDNTSRWRVDYVLKLFRFQFVIKGCQSFNPMFFVRTVESMCSPIERHSI